ncbi:hypothetical protein B0H17DRAFT_912692, partial [Mycena rosella]
PVLTLPHEITSEIFIHCLPPSPVFSAQFPDGPNALEAPLLLLQICKKWSSIAISTPDLWVYLRVNVGRRPPSPQLEKFIEDWFHRAGSRPLSLSV